MTQDQPYHSAPLGRLFAADDFDFAARTAIGHAARGVSDIGQVLATLSQIDSGDVVGWYSAWQRTADAQAREAVAAEKVQSSRSPGRLSLVGPTVRPPQRLGDSRKKHRCRKRANPARKPPQRRYRRPSRLRFVPTAR